MHEHSPPPQNCYRYEMIFSNSLKCQVITLAPQESPKQKMQPFSPPKGGSWSQAFHSWTEETGGESSLLMGAVFCEEFLGKNRAFNVDVTYKDVDCFRKASVHEL